MGGGERTDHPLPQRGNEIRKKLLKTTIAKSPADGEGELPPKTRGVSGRPDR